MPDMLVNLLRLPPLEPLLAAGGGGVLIRRAQVWETSAVRRCGLISPASETEEPAEAGSSVARVP